MRLSVGMVLVAFALTARFASAVEIAGATEIAGAKLQELRGGAVSAIRVYAVRDGKAVPIPFQIDERNERGRWIIAGGPAKPVDETPGRLDDNDVVVFMNRDLGGRATAASLPAARRWMEILVGTEAAPLGYAYLGVFDAPPPLSDVDYCRYVAREDRVETPAYQTTFGAPFPRSLRIGGGENLLRAMRASGEARFFGGMFTLRRSERDISATLEGWKDGPVRVIRPAKYKIGLPLGFNATARVNLHFYRDFVVGHAVARVVIPPRLVPADGELTASFDFASQDGAQLFVPGLGLSEVVNGRMTPGKRRLNDHQARWAALVLPSKQAFLIAVRPEGSLETLEQRIHFRDGVARPSFGFQLAHVNRLETGEHDLYVAIVLLESDRTETIERAASLLRSPPKVRVTDFVPER